MGGMKANDIIIYTDMDGTVLSDWDLGPVVPERNLRLIRQFVEAGGCFSVASGRQAPDIRGFFPGVAFKAPLVCGNGAVVYDAAAGRLLRKVPLPAPYKRDCLDYVLSHRDVWLVAADEHAIYQVALGDPARDNVLDDIARIRISMERFLAEDLIKAVYIIPDGGNMEKLKAEVAELSTHELVIGAQSGPRYYEMVERSVTKADGIRFARKAAGLEGRTLVCIGDYFNDWAMLQAADIAACPANSPREVKDICRIVTCGNNEGAVADLIEQLNLW